MAFFGRRLAECFLGQVVISTIPVLIFKTGLFGYGSTLYAVLCVLDLLGLLAFTFFTCRKHFLVVLDRFTYLNTNFLAVGIQCLVSSLFFRIPALTELHDFICLPFQLTVVLQGNVPVLSSILSESRTVSALSVSFLLLICVYLVMFTVSDEEIEMQHRIFQMNEVVPEGQSVPVNPPIKPGRR
ncbi:MAG: hypothetical protein MJ078_06490 [Clostridia bacterium]|nr:hypothetical protein [Clostridia bacterium]